MVLLDLCDDHVGGIVALAQSDVAVAMANNAASDKDKIIDLPGTAPTERLLNFIEDALLERSGQDVIHMDAKDSFDLSVDLLQEDARVKGVLHPLQLVDHDIKHVQKPLPRCICLAINWSVEHVQSVRLLSPFRHCFSRDSILGHTHIDLLWPLVVGLALQEG